MQLLVEIISLHKINQEKLSSFQQVSVEVEALRLLSPLSAHFYSSFVVLYDDRLSPLRRAIGKVQ